MVAGLQGRDSPQYLNVPKNVPVAPRITRVSRIPRDGGEGLTHCIS
jgi:hypothetical protein